MLGWVTLTGVSLLVEWRGLERNAFTMAVLEADSNSNKDLAYRRWVALQGGVYVPISVETPSSPYLSQTPDRDVVTTSGKRLTLINPAYMTRLVHELNEKQFGVRGHITSLQPIRPENKADAWEAKALQSFESGVTETSSIETIDGHPFLRFMRPMVTETSCLKCHAGQGYKKGDIRGGISFSVPFTPFLEKSEILGIQAALIHGLFGGLGFLCIWLFGRFVVRSQDTMMSKAQLLAEAQRIAHIGSWKLFLGNGKESWSGSDELKNIFGYPQDKQFTMDSCIERIHPDDRQATVVVWEAVLNGTSPNAWEHRIVVDGIIKWIRVQVVVKRNDINGKISEVSGTCQDISERKQTEDRLQTSEDRYKKLITSMAQGFALHQIITT